MNLVVIGGNFSIKVLSFNSKLLAGLDIKGLPKVGAKQCFMGNQDEITFSFPTLDTFHKLFLS
ncbi:hypothetical protein IQ247_25765 [Plectonema cf. radiosum LEGE 06105]|uniref:Uncharacterized protein n=1 Tax=Plectonema cf. radiosum LEGE 06105 TaxID=945769 RepID=A0A8J7K6X2_9CYAN|nr:hypothetical protein [Plectonema radiosum]MBE9216027.1 hypothetical protein [Plectonema cf. radiosum LEGE 06105]